jgi:hypothetical protein
VTPAAKSKWTQVGNNLIPTATATQTLEWGSTIKTDLYLDTTGGILYSMVNNYFGPQDATKPSWTSALDILNDHFIVLRRAANAAAGANTSLLTLDNAGNLTIGGAHGYKTSGSTWEVGSDIRLKKNIAPYARGLADILKLQPIRYTLKACGTETCGFDAATVRDVFPECVSTTRMKLDPADDEETDDVLVFDMHPILVAIVNAIKELANGRS